MDSQKINRMFTWAKWGFALAEWMMIILGVITIKLGIEDGSTVLVCSGVFFFYLTWRIYKLQTKWLHEQYIKFKRVVQGKQLTLSQIRLKQRFETQIYNRWNPVIHRNEERKVRK